MGHLFLNNAPLFIPIPYVAQVQSKEMLVGLHELENLSSGKDLKVMSAALLYHRSG